MSNEIEQTEQKDRDEKGQYITGNSQWRLGAWQPGNEGRPNLFTPIELRDLVIQYVQDRESIKKTITLSGLRIYLGLSIAGLRAYRLGEIGKAENDKLAYMYVLDQFDGYMEDEAESKLDREHGSTKGIEFRMKNMWPTVWKDSKHISVDTSERRTIKLVLDPDSALAKRLLADNEDTGILIEHIGEGGE